MNSRITYQIKFLCVEFLLLPFYPEVTNRSNQTGNILFQITLCFKNFLTNCQKFCVWILYNKICKFSEKWEKVASLALYSCTASAHLLSEGGMGMCSSRSPWPPSTRTSFCCMHGLLYFLYFSNFHKCWRLQSLYWVISKVCP